MSESPLQLSIKWIKLLADGKERIAAGDFVGALPVLESALAAIEAVDAFSNPESPDIRVADTLERIAFAYQQQGSLDKAEPLYRRAMEIANTHILGVHLRTAIYQNLAKLLNDTGRAEEGKALLAKYPLEGGAEETVIDPIAEGKGIEAAIDAFAEAAVAIAEESAAKSKVYVMPSNEVSIVQTLNILAFMNGESAQRVLSFMQEIVEHTEFCYGTLSQEFTEVAEKLARGYMHTFDMSSALPYLQKALFAKMSVGVDDSEIESLSVDLAMCNRESALSKALIAKYHRPAKFDDPLTLAASIMSKIAAAQGEVAKPLPTIAAAQAVGDEEAEKTIEEWRAEQALAVKAPAFMTMEEKCRQLLPLAEKAVALAREVEANDSHPFSLVCLLSEKVKLHQELGEKAEALKVKQQELEVITKHWGEGHQLTVEAYLAFTKMQQEM